MGDRIVGVTFDDGSIRAAEIERPRWGRRRDRAHTVLRCVTHALPAGIIDNGALIDSDALAEHLRELWDTAGFSTRRVALGLDARAAVIRRARLPRLSHGELQQAARYEIAELLSYPLSEALISAVVVGDASDAVAGEGIDTVILAVHERAVVELRTAASAAGLRVRSTELVQSGLVAAVAAVSPVASGSLGMVVDVDSSVTNIVFHDAEGLVFSRVVTAGIDGDRPSLSDELGAELAMLETFTRPAVSAPSTAPDSVVAGLSTVVEGVRRTADYVGSEVDPTPLTQLVVTGAQASAAGLTSTLAEVFPDAEVLRRDAPSAVVDGTEQGGYDGAVGVATSSLTPPATARRFVLVPRAVERRDGDRVRLAVGALAALAVAPMLVTEGLDRYRAVSDTHAEIERVELAIADLDARLAAYDEDRDRQALAEEANRRVDELVDEQLPVTAVIGQVAEAMPADSFVVALRVVRTDGDAVPTGYAGPTPDAMVSVTGVAPDLDGVGRWLESVDSVPGVDGLWLSQSSVTPYGDDELPAALFTVEGVVASGAEGGQ